MSPSEFCRERARMWMNTYERARQTQQWAAMHHAGDRAEEAEVIAAQLEEWERTR